MHVFLDYILIKIKKNFVYVSEGVNNALVPMRVGSKRMFPIITIEG